MKLVPGLEISWVFLCVGLLICTYLAPAARFVNMNDSIELLSMTFGHPESVSSTCNQSISRDLYTWDQDIFTDIGVLGRQLHDG